MKGLFVLFLVDVCVFEIWWLVEIELEGFKWWVLMLLFFILLEFEVLNELLRGIVLFLFVFKEFLVDFKFSFWDLVNCLK